MWSPVHIYSTTILTRPSVLTRDILSAKKEKSQLLKQTHWCNCRLQKEKHKSYNSEHLLLCNLSSTGPRQPGNSLKECQKKNTYTFQWNLEDQKQLAEINTDAFHIAMATSTLQPSGDNGRRKDWIQTHSLNKRPGPGGQRKAQSSDSDSSCCSSVLQRPAGCGLQFHIDSPTIVSDLHQIHQPPPCSKGGV